MDRRKRASRVSFERTSNHIAYRPWVERAKRADAFQEDDFIGAMRGVRAPYGTMLEVKGGWLDDSCFEKLDPNKAQRSEWIAINGFT
jgi:hypothetical protein